jgi:predicted TIM-barrel enzyme
VQSIIKATKRVNPDIICLAHGGPIVGPDDTKYIYQHTDAVGFVGASSIERIPIERAVKGAVEEFKGILLKRRGLNVPRNEINA